MSITFIDNTQNVLDDIDKANELALAQAAEQLKSEIIRVKKPPQVRTGFYHASIYATGQTLTISGSKKLPSGTVSGTPKSYIKSKTLLAIDVISGADYGVWLEFKDFTHVGVLAPFRRGAVNAIEPINKIFAHFLTT